MVEADRILVLAPHTDDGELGCGATIARFIEEGKQVYYVAFSTCEESVPEGFPKDILTTEVKRATAVLGIPAENLIILNFKVRYFPRDRQMILEEMVRINKEIKPDLVFLPSSFDVHQDHKTIFEEGRRAFKSTRLLGYEFMWNNYSFNASCSILVSEAHIEKKIKALEEYQSQAHRFYASEKLVKGLGHYRGLQLLHEYAESFEVIRWII